MAAWSSNSGVTPIGLVGPSVLSSATNTRLHSTAPELVLERDVFTECRLNCLAEVGHECRASTPEKMVALTQDCERALAKPDRVLLEQALPQPSSLNR